MPWCKEDPQSHEAVFSIHINDEPDDKWNTELQPHRYLMKASTNPHLQLKMMRIRLLNWWCIYNINSIIKTSMQLQCQKLVFSFSKVIWHQRCTEPLTVIVHPHVRKNFQVLQRSVISCLLLDHIFSKAFVTLATLSVLWCRTRVLFMAKLSMDS